MSGNRDISTALAEDIMQAAADNSPLYLHGHNSKSFYGRSCDAQPFDVSGHSGIIDYDPSELVITARAGTSLHEIETTLAEQRQCLAFEPPHFGDSTLGGCIATGLSGPRRPHAGAARDFVLGTRCINGRGEILSFGGQVMKNVAGYDVSRLMCGALGTLGVLLDVSLKVLPVDEYSVTRVSECPDSDAIQHMNTLAGRPLPLTAAAWHDNRLYLRLSGNRAAVEAASKKLAGDLMGEDDARTFWQSLRDQQHAFFAGDAPLWRLSLPPATLALHIEGELLIDWGGAQRWYRSHESADVIRTLCSQHGGHATLFRHGDRNSDVFQPLAPGLAQLHRSLKQAFDPHGLFNPGHMYRDW
ncbi:MAG: glycolate oxidase subunit GlcE [Granulosicoccaceae bacterium]|jgi:glycolate oxidase FAD binding subunit